MITSSMTRCLVSSCRFENVGWTRRIGQDQRGPPDPHRAIGALGITFKLVREYYEILWLLHNTLEITLCGYPDTLKGGNVGN